MRLAFIIGLFLTLVPLNSSATKLLALKLVASIEDKIVTSRDVEANYIVDRSLYSDGKLATFSVGTSEFTEALSRLLVEMMVSEEAAFFEVAKVGESEIDEAFKNVKIKINDGALSKARWAHLAYSDSQLRQMVERKLRANRFIKYKSNSSYVEPGDEEAEDYFNKNRLKFGTMQFSQFKTNIKKFLGTKSAEERLRDWFDVLRKKHRVKNFMTGSVSYDFSSTPHK